MREEIVGNSHALSAQMLDGAVEVDRVPMNDGGGDETEARGAEALVLERAVSNLTLTMKEDRTPQRVAGLALVEPGMAALPQIGIG